MTSILLLTTLAKRLRLAVWLGLWIVAIPAAYASEDSTWRVKPGLPFGVPVALRLAPDTAYRLKVCISDERRETLDATGLECGGETFEGGVWHSQTRSWDLFPLVAADSSGELNTVLTARYLTSPISRYLYVVALPEGKSSSARKAYFIGPLTDAPSSVLRAEVCQSQNGGWVRSVSGRLTQWWPVFDQVATILTDSRDVHLTYIPSRGLPEEPIGRVALPPRGVASISVGCVRPAFNPRAIGPTKAAVGEKTVWRLEGSRPIEGEVVWRVNGALVATGPTLADPTLPVGIHRITATLKLTGETATLTVEIVPNFAVRLNQVVANPSEGSLETAEVVNTGQAPVSLDGWVIRSPSNRRLRLSGVLLANQRAIFHSRGFFANRGGTFDLLDPFETKIDRVVYAASPEGTTWRRDHQSVVWKPIPPPTEGLLRQSFSGVVTDRRGRSLEIAEPSGRRIRFTVDATLPKMSRGDSISITGAIGRIVFGAVRWRIDAETIVTIEAANSGATRLGRVFSRARAAPSVNRMTNPAVGGRSPPGDSTPKLLPSGGHDGYILVVVSLLFAIGIVLAVPRRV